MTTSDELAETLLKLFDIPGLGSMAGGAALLAMILSWAWIYARKMMKKAEATRAREHNNSEPEKVAAQAKIENRVISQEWADAQNDVDDLMNQEGEGTEQQPPEPKSDEGE